MDFSKLPSTSSAEYVPMLARKRVGNKPFTVIVEGNIGAGKTTFLNHFMKYEKLCSVVPEPVELWRDYRGVNLMVNFSNISNVFCFFE